MPSNIILPANLEKLLSNQEHSDIRPVPDHQEIFLSSTGFASIIFDIAERVSHLPSDEEALIYHFEDVVNPGDNSKIWHSREVVLTRFA